MKVVVDYSPVESEDINPFLISANPSNFLIFNLTNPFICTNCQKFLTFHKSDKCITLRCSCGCRIFYPKNEKGIKLSKFISKDDYKKKGGIDE